MRGLCTHGTKMQGHSLRLIMGAFDVIHSGNSERISALGREILLDIFGTGF
jgi:hypothetical protein